MIFKKTSRDRPKKALNVAKSPALRNMSESLKIFEDLDQNLYPLEMFKDFCLREFCLERMGVRRTGPGESEGATGPHEISE